MLEKYKIITIGTKKQNIINNIELIMVDFPMQK